MRPKYEAVKGFLLTIILVGDAVAMMVLVIVMSSIAATTSVLLCLSPFIPDWQVRLSQALPPNSAIVLLFSLAWVILTTLLGSRLCKGEVRLKCRQVQPFIAQAQTLVTRHLVKPATTGRALTAKQSVF